ncbi:MAG: hypothetical protein OHK0022_27650 [Roseiflexaceae bacterium]
MTKTAAAKAKSAAATAGIKAAVYLPPPIELPEDLAGWQINVFNDRNPIEIKLVSPDRQWQTKTYIKLDRAIAEARRWLLSQPQPATAQEEKLEPAPLDPAPLDPSLLQRIEAAGSSIEALPDGRYQLRLGSLFDRPVPPDLIEATLARYEAYLAETAQAQQPARPEPAPLDPDLLRRLQVHGGRVESGRSKVLRNGTHYLVILPDFHGRVLPARLAAMLDNLDALEAPAPVAPQAQEPPRGIDALMRAGLVDQAEQLAQQGRVWGVLLGVAHRWAPDGAGWSAVCGQAINGGYLPDGATGPTRCARCDFEAATPVATPPVERSIAEILEAHAKTLPAKPSADTLFPRPDGLADRFEAPIGLVVPGRDQPRTEFDDAGLMELADSIREHGILTPLTVFASEAGRLELVGGERRWCAAQRVGLATVPVSVGQWTLAQIAEIALIDNIQRRQLSPIEEGKAFERLISIYGYSENKLAERLGLNRGAVQQRRAMAVAAPEVGEALARGEFGFAVLRAIAQGAKGNPAAQLDALERCRRHSKYDGKLDEARARQYVQDAIIATARDSLSALGWKVATTWLDSKSVPIVYSDGDMPRVVSAADIAAMLEAQQRPSAPPSEPAQVLSGTEKAALKRRGSKVSADLCPPWGVELAGKKIKTLSPVQLLEAARQAQREIAQVENRLKARGWSVTWRDDGSGSVKAKGPDSDREEWTDSFAATLKLCETLEAGLPPSARHQPKCDRCGQKRPHAGFRSWINAERRRTSGNICLECEQQIRAQRDERISAIRADIGQGVDEWLGQAPALLLQLLLASLPKVPLIGLDRYMSAEARAHKILAVSTAEQLRAATADALLTIACELQEEGFKIPAAQTTQGQMEVLTSRAQAVAAELRAAAEDAAPPLSEQRIQDLRCEVSSISLALDELEDADLAGDSGDELAALAAMVAGLCATLDDIDARPDSLAEGAQAGNSPLAPLERRLAAVEVALDNTDEPEGARYLEELSAEVDSIAAALLTLTESPAFDPALSIPIVQLSDRIETARNAIRYTQEEQQLSVLDGQITEIDIYLRHLTPDQAVTDGEKLRNYRERLNTIDVALEPLGVAGAHLRQLNAELRAWIDEFLAVGGAS